MKKSLFTIFFIVCIILIFVDFDSKMPYDFETIYDKNIKFNKHEFISNIYVKDKYVIFRIVYSHFNDDIRRHEQYVYLSIYEFKNEKLFHVKNLEKNFNPEFDRGYLVDKDYKSNSIKIYDFKDPLDIKLLTKIKVDTHTIFDVFFNDKIKFLYHTRSRIDDGWEVYDINDANNIKRFANMKFGLDPKKSQKDYKDLSDLYGHSFTVDENGTKLVFGTDFRHSALILIDTTDKKDFKILDYISKPFHNRNSIATSASMDELLFHNDYLYIAGNEGALLVFDTKYKKLNKIQQTDGTHLKMMFNNTGNIYSIAIDKKRDLLYVVGFKDNDTKNYKSFIKEVNIKGVKKGYYFHGDLIRVLKNNYLIINGRDNNIRILKIIDK